MSSPTPRDRVDEGAVRRRLRASSGSARRARTPSASRDRPVRLREIERQPVGEDLQPGPMLPVQHAGGGDGADRAAAKRRIAAVAPSTSAPVDRRRRGRCRRRRPRRPRRPAAGPGPARGRPARRPGRRSGPAGSTRPPGAPCRSSEPVTSRTGRPASRSRAAVDGGRVAPVVADGGDDAARRAPARRSARRWAGRRRAASPRTSAARARSLLLGGAVREAAERRRTPHPAPAASSSATSA